VSDYSLAPCELCFRYIIARTSYISMRWWWCSLYSRPTCLVGFL